MELPCTQTHTHTRARAHARTHIVDVDSLDKLCFCGRFRGFYIYVITRRLAGLLINFKETDWSRVPKLYRHVFFKGPPGHLLKNRIQFGPAQNKMYLITQWTVSETQSCQTLQLIIAVFFLFLN